MSGFLFGIISGLGRYAIRQIRAIGQLTLFSLAVFRQLPASFARFFLIVQQVHFIGNYSLVITLGVLVALALMRELGPVVTALLFAGRAGTSLTAEIGLMRAGEQLAAMEMMGVDPVRRIMAPRFAGVMISMPVLAMIFSTMGIIGAWVVGVGLIGTDNGAFWSQMQGGVDFYTDVLNGIVKSVVFGVAVGLIALFQGYSARPTPDGVSRATTRTVVISSLMVLGLDFIMTAFMFSGI